MEKGKTKNWDYQLLSKRNFSGYSFVYLIKDESNHSLYALKKIKCALGDQAITDAMHEVEMYRLFQSEYIINILVINKGEKVGEIFKRDEILNHIV